MHATFRPLVWTGPVTPDARRRSRHTFRSGWQDTLDLLERELKFLKAKEVLIEADFREQDITLRGMPRSNAPVPKFPGVRVTFDSKAGPLRYQSDKCAFWQHNVRSIALGLESLRAVERHGITLNNEQYVGWKQLESGPNGAGRMLDADATALLRKVAGDDTASWPLTDVVRRAKAKAYPDVSHDRDLWDRVQVAITTLGL